METAAVSPRNTGNIRVRYRTFLSPLIYRKLRTSFLLVMEERASCARSGAQNSKLQDATDVRSGFTGLPPNVSSISIMRPAIYWRAMPLDTATNEAFTAPARRDWSGREPIGYPE